MNEVKKFKISIPAHLNYSEFVRLFAFEIARDAGLSKHDSGIVKLIMDELYVNAVRYGSNEKSSIYIEGSFVNGEVMFSIEDEGVGLKKIDAKSLEEIIQKELSNNDPTKTHGRGLSQITSLMATEFKISDSKLGGIKTEFIKRKGEDQKKEHEHAGEHKKKNIDREKKMFILSGEIGMHNIEDVISPINLYLEKVSHPVVLIFDCNGLEYVNTIFIGNLASWHMKLDNFGGEIIMQDANEFVTHVIDLIGLKKLIKFENSNENI